MQFMPATWKSYGRGGDIQDPRDAILAAGRFLAAAGAARERVQARCTATTRRRSTSPPSRATRGSCAATRSRSTRCTPAARPSRRLTRAATFTPSAAPGSRSGKGFDTGRDACLAVQGWPSPARCSLPPRPRRPHRRRREHPAAPPRWAPADKHGFATAHSTAGQRLPHAPAGLRERGLLPGPEHARLPRAPVRRRRRRARRRARPWTTTRRHIEPVARRRDGARAGRSRGSLAFKQTTETAQWRLTKTWITDPARPTVLARVRFESQDGPQAQALRPGRSGPGRRRRRRSRPRAGRLGRRRGERRRRHAAPQGRDVGLQAAPRSDPWRQLERSGKLRRYDAPRGGQRLPGRADRARRRARSRR